MSRLSDYDDFEGEPEQILAMGRWERNARVALKGKRGRKALAELWEALMALPVHRLIEGAVCTVGAETRRAALLAEAEADAGRARESALRLAVEYDAEGRPEIAARMRAAAERDRQPDTDRVEELDDHVKRDGEGVCAVGAYAWHQKVKAGLDPVEAFAALPDLAEEGSDALTETADLGKGAGLTYTLAWELAYRNDETFSSCTPEERWEKFVAWIDAELAGTPA
jgi:hypothetical protein